MTSLSERITAAVKAKGLSFRGIARITGVDQRTMLRYAKDRAPPSDVLARIAIATGVSARWLLLGEGEMFEQRTFEQRFEDLRAAAAMSREYVARALLETKAIDDRERGVALPGVLVGLYDAAEHLPDPFVASALRRILHVAAVRDQRAIGAVLDTLRAVDPGPERAGLLASTRDSLKPNVEPDLKP